MNPLLLLVDLQNDYLAAPGLEPAAGEIVRGAAHLLEGARARGVPVVHAVTSVDPRTDDRMPHWKARGRWICVRGTPGEAPPRELAPRDGEPVVSKTFFSAFGSPRLAAALEGARADTLVVAGLYLHGCVRATVLDAYERGYEVWIAEDAIGSDDPLHAAVTRRYLEGRAARFAPVETLLRRIAGEDPSEAAPLLPAAVVGGRAVAAAPGPWPVHRSPRDGRALFAVPAAAGGGRRGRGARVGGRPARLGAAPGVGSAPSRSTAWRIGSKRCPARWPAISPSTSASRSRRPRPKCGGRPSCCARLRRRRRIPGGGAAPRPSGAGLRSGSSRS